MEDIKNEYYNTLGNDDKEKYKILFVDNDTKDDFNKKLKEFIELLYKHIEATDENNQKNIFSVVDLSFVCFHEQYDFTDKNSSLNKIFCKYGILEYYENNEKKQCSRILKRISFSNATFKKQIEFIRVTFEKQVSFEGTIFLDNANFQEVIFKEDTEGIEELQGTIFEGVKFYKEAIFNEAEFKGKAKFFRTKFKDYTSFHKTKFYNTVSFENAVSKDLFYFHDVSIGELDLIGFHYEKANFLILTNIDKSNPILTKANFKNKDTARIIKAHFEQQNNITEANIYFVLEQEFFLDLLSKENSAYPNQTIDKVSLLFNKYVSNYGTDWVRVLIIMFGFGFSASLGYSFFDSPVKLFFYPYILKDYIVDFNLLERYILLLSVYYSFILYLLYDESSKENNSKGWCWFFLWLFVYIIVFMLSDVLQAVNNKTISLINPLNIFNQDIAILQNNTIHKNINYFETIALYGIFVKGVAVTLIYQFIISFRNSSRRK